MDQTTDELSLSPKQFVVVLPFVRSSTYVDICAACHRSIHILDYFQCFSETDCSIEGTCVWCKCKAPDEHDECQMLLCCFAGTSDLFYGTR